MSHQTSIETWHQGRGKRVHRAACACGFHGLWVASREAAASATPEIDGARICPRSLKPVDFGPEPATLDDLFAALGAGR